MDQPPELESVTSTTITSSTTSKIFVEEVLTKEQALEKNSKIQRGYAFVPVVEKNESLIIDGKRCRKQSKMLEIDIPETPRTNSFATPSSTANKKRKNTSNLTPEDAPSDDLLKRKMELEAKLAALKQQLAKVAKTPTALSYDTPVAKPTKLQRVDSRPELKKTPSSSGGKEKRNAVVEIYEEPFDETNIQVVEESLLFPKCKNILDVLWHKKGAEFFTSPVDWKKYNLLDYPTIVTNPMDLGTIKSNLNAGLISNFDEFCSLVRLVFRNCYAYNPYF